MSLGSRHAPVCLIMIIDLPTDYQLLESGTLRLACPPGSPLAAVIVELWRSRRMREFAVSLRRHADVGRETGRGECHAVVMAFLNACGSLDVRAVWARTPTGWHTWVEYGGEAFDVVLDGEGRPLVLVQEVESFRAMRGIAPNEANLPILERPVGSTTSLSRSNHDQGRDR